MTLGGNLPRKTLDTGDDRSPGLKLCAMTFDGLDAPILLPEAPRLIADLRRCIHGWPSRLIPFDPKSGPVTPPISVVEHGGSNRFRAFSRYLEEGLDDLPTATVVCSVLADLSQAFCEADPGLVFGLHCGAIAMGGYGVILAGERRAGKSTLVARLSAEEGVEVLCDDVLPVDSAAMAIGLGLALRLRLPLPDSASPGFRAHVARWLGPADDRYGYLIPPALMAHGRRVPTDAFILLDRRPDAKAALHGLPDDEVLRCLIDRSITGPEGTEAVFKAAQALACRLTGLRLVYWDLEQAIALIKAAFPTDGGKFAEAIQVLPPVPSSLATGLAEDAVVSASTRFRRVPGTATRRVSEAAFLWRPDDAMLWHLNQTAQAIWTLLSRPATARSLARDLGHIYPEVPPQQLLGDTCKLLALLEIEGFVAPDRKARTAGRGGHDRPIAAAQVSPR
jgi:hypothetical protein